MTTWCYHRAVSLVMVTLDDMACAPRAIGPCNATVQWRKLAIANGFAIGQLPNDGYQWSTAEHYLVAVAQAVIPITLVSGGGPRALQSHTMAFRADAQAPATGLPRDPTQVECRVVYGGGATPEARRAGKRRSTVRRQRLMWTYWNTRSAITYTRRPSTWTAAAHRTIITQCTTAPQMHVRFPS